jgi:hypothetical protein
LAENGEENSAQKDKKTVLQEKLKELESDEGNQETERPEGSGLHADKATFEKNFCLSPEQKEFAITKCEQIVSEILDPEMSDLEKYYRLAVWEAIHVTYDSDFWVGRYHLDLYRHQWDAYGVLTDDSVCVGMATFYANLCHAADLPCKIVRCNPEILDHTINYVPDINGNAYYVDVTENMFLMGPNGVFVDGLDIDFAHITKVPAESTFEYFSNKAYHPTDLKECYYEKCKDCSQGDYKLTYDEWFREYALHEGTDKTFTTPYDEKGSGKKAGQDGYHHASYHDYESQYTENPEIWFIEDFYQDPEKQDPDDPDAVSKDLTGITDKIRNKEFDERLLNISGLKDSYYYENPVDIEVLKADVSRDISVRYFPTSENNEVVAKGADLTNGEDYNLTLDTYDESTGEAVFAISGTGNYHGSQTISVRVNSAIVKKTPVRKKKLVYNGSPQSLVEPGEAENGTMVYAAVKAGTQEPESDLYTGDIPSAVDAGKYDIWYKAAGAEGYNDSDPNYSEPEAAYVSVVVTPKETKKPVSISNAKVALSKTAFTYNDKVHKPTINKIKGKALKSGTDYTVKITNNKGKTAASPKAAGTYTVNITGKGNYTGKTKAAYKINKAANKLKIKAKTAKVKFSAVKKKARTLAVSKVITFTNKGQGTKTYKKASGNKKITINKKTGKVTVKKGLKKGTYKVKVKVRAAGNTNYKASGWKAVTFKVQVK